MIKFFRHIRKSLIENNQMGNPTSAEASASKTTSAKATAGKYLKYAIGEIVLVVIGILIALQINNWNEGRKDRLKEQELLGQLQAEYQSNLNQLDQKIALRYKMMSSSLKLLDYKDRPEKRNTDSIYKHISFTVLAPTFDPIVNDIISSGRIQLLQNKELRELLSRWTSEVIQVTEEEVAWSTYRNEIYYQGLSKYSSFRTIINQYWKNDTMDSFRLEEGESVNFDLGDSKRNQDLALLFDNSDFEDHVAMCYSWNKIANTQSEVLRGRILEILNLIDGDLK